MNKADATYPSRNMTKFFEYSPGQAITMADFAQKAGARGHAPAKFSR
ncbi:hypothetical protein [Caballeronia grimmiae]|nr:hypothetical protein [Caballeronia grimmiae]